MPSPTCLVVKNGSKILLSLPSGMPWPEFGDLDDDVVALEDHRAVAVQVAVQPLVAGGDADLAAPRHGVAGVDDEVHDHLLELALVDADRGEVGTLLDLQRHLVGQQPVQQVRELGERVLEVDDRGPQRLLAREGEELADEGGGAVGVLADLHQVAVLLVGDVVAHQQQVAVAVDRGQEVVEVVGDAAGELADRLHLLALDELGLEGLELGGVGEDREQRRGAVEHGAGEGDLQEHLLAVGGAAGDLGAAEGAALDRVGEALGDRAAEALDQIGEADAGRGALAEELAGGGVGVGQPAIGLEAGDRHRQLVEEVVGHQPGDLGAVEGDEQEVAEAVGAGKHHRTHGAPGRGQQVHAVGPERRVGEHVEPGRTAGERGGGGVRIEDAAVAVEAQPGDAGLAQRCRGPRRLDRLDAPEQGATAVAGDDDPAAAVRGQLAGDAVEAGFAGQAVAGGLGAAAGGGQRIAVARGGVAGEHVPGEVGDEHRAERALEMADAVPPGGGQRGAAAQGQQIEAEDQQRRRDRRRRGGGVGAAGEGGSEQQRPDAGEDQPGAQVAAGPDDPAVCLVLHRAPAREVRGHYRRPAPASTIGNVTGA